MVKERDERVSEERRWLHLNKPANDDATAIPTSMPRAASNDQRISSNSYRNNRRPATKTAILSLSLSSSSSSQSPPRLLRPRSPKFTKFRMNRSFLLLFLWICGCILIAISKEDNVKQPLWTPALPNNNNSNNNHEREPGGNIYSQQPMITGVDANEGRGGGFVHLGKTGGSTLSRLLRNGCHSFLPHPCRTVANESLVSILTTSYYHVPDFGLLRNRSQEHDFLIITIRDPFDRTVSAFCYEHIRNVRARQQFAKEETAAQASIQQPQQPSDTPPDSRSDGTFQGKSEQRLSSLEEAYRCFPTLEAFVQHLDGNSLDFDYPLPRNAIPFGSLRSHKISCQTFARAVFHGRVRPFIHLYFNMQRIQSLLSEAEASALSGNVAATTKAEEEIVNPVPVDDDDLLQQQQQQQHYQSQETTSQKKATIVYVIRQEHLDEDWTRINQLLATGRATTADSGTVITERRRSTTELESQKLLPVTRTLSPAGTQILCRALQQEYNSYFQFLQNAPNISPQDLQGAMVRAKKRCPGLYVQEQ